MPKGGRGIAVPQPFLRLLDAVGPTDSGPEGVAAFAPNLPTAIALLLGRFVLSQMDVSARQTYVVAVVLPGERTAAAGYTNSARYVTRPLAPPVAAALYGSGLLGAPFLVAGTLKCVYDVTYLLFRRVPVRPNEP